MKLSMYMFSKIYLRKVISLKIGRHQVDFISDQRQVEFISDRRQVDFKFSGKFGSCRNQLVDVCRPTISTDGHADIPCRKMVGFWYIIRPSPGRFFHSGLNSHHL